MFKKKYQDLTKEEVENFYKNYENKIIFKI